MPSEKEIIAFAGVEKWYDQFKVLKGIDLSVKSGERIVICGPSGSGKSTMIRCINGLEGIQKGRITVAGIDISASKANATKVREHVGMVFQQFNLFPHLTVLENCVLSPVRSQKLSKSQAQEIAMHYLSRVRIPEQANKYPSQLSGGQQQRVADRVIFMADGEIVEQAPPDVFFDSPQHPKTRNFLGQILNH